MALLTRVLVAAVSMLLASMARPDPAAARVQASEADVKAAFLYNFTKYIEWPSGAFANATDPFRVCVLADEDFTRTVETFMTGEAVQTRQVRVIVPRLSDLPRCHILFVGRQAAGRERSALAATAGRPVLTVGETPQFLEQGGVVLFHVEDRRVRFDLHLEAASQAGLAVSSKLVRVAHHVREGSPR